MKGKLKANTVDRYLAPVREQMVAQTKSDSNVIEFGCGTGDLLFKLSSKIIKGIGIDYSPKLIEFANKRKEKENIENISFQVADINTYQNNEHFDISIASLVFHVLTPEMAAGLLDKMIEVSDTLIICAFSKPENFKQRFLLWLDQRFSGHYTHYKSYANNDFMEGLLNNRTDIQYECFSTFDPVIKIYRIITIK